MENKYELEISNQQLEKIPKGAPAAAATANGINQRTITQYKPQRGYMSTLAALVEAKESQKVSL